MWLLSSSGNLFGDKRHWLRPGTTNLIGRTSNNSSGGEIVKYIESRGVSRKHIILTIAAEDAGRCAQLHTRSSVEILEDSKFGSWLNGVSIHKTARTVREDEERGVFELRLGNYEQVLKLEWVPCVVSLTGLGKRAPVSVEQWRERLALTGVKVVSEYVTNVTTHVVAAKRNTAPGLQALVQGKWLVADKFVEALMEVCVERDGVDEKGDPIRFIPLEADFDGSWPKEAECIVPAASEPMPRPNEVLKPDPRRAQVFQDFTFVFLATHQYEQLMGAIMAGSGKALAFDFKARNGSVQDVVDFVKDLAGKKGSRQFALSQLSGPGGIVIVRAKDKEEGRNNEFMRDLDIALDQRSVEQGEFLDAILMNDASGLRRALEDSPQSDAQDDEQPAATGQVTASTREDPRASRTSESPACAAGPSTRTRQNAPPENVRPLSAHQTVEEEPAMSDQQAPVQSAAARWRNRRLATKSRFQGFDDIDPSQVARPPSESPEPIPLDPSPEPSVQGMDVDDAESQRQSTQRSTRKRPAPVDDDDEEIEDHDKMLDRMMPGQQAMKRRRTEAAKKAEQRAANRSSVEPAEPDEPEQRPDKTGKSKKGAANKKDTKDPILKVDVKAQMRARKEREEAERRKDEESLYAATNGEIETLEPKVSYFALPVRAPREERENAAPGKDWDPAWNGRKNFKKFRSNKAHRAGEAAADEGSVPELPRVRVRLREVPKRGHELGDDFWLQERAKSGSKSQSQTGRSVTAAAGEEVEEVEDPTMFRRRLQRSREQDEANATLDDAFLEEDGIRPNGTGSTLRGSAASQSQILRGTGSRGAATTTALGKRPAATAMGPPAAKRARTGALGGQDSDEDPTAFRRKRR